MPERPPAQADKAFPSWVVREIPSGEPKGGIEQLTRESLPDVDGPAVTVAVEYSSLNYKDALACRGHRGVVRGLPHVPGIDCAGTVTESDRADLSPGDPVLITGYDLGAPRWGGYSAVVRAPAEWAVPMPEGLTPRQAMTFGTAGFTAAQCVMAIETRVAPDAGPVAVTGATGGVGVFAVALLAKLGYKVCAVTGKQEQADVLRGLGAAEVAPREDVAPESDKPMLPERWAAAVDTVGGAALSGLLRSTRHRGVVAACGMAGGADLPLTVYPFILRGVTLAGIDSAKCPHQPRLEVWRRLAGPWRVDLPSDLVTEIDFGGLEQRVAAMLAGKTVGRTLVRPSA